MSHNLPDIRNVDILWEGFKKCRKVEWAAKSYNTDNYFLTDTIQPTHSRTKAHINAALLHKKSLRNDAFNYKQERAIRCFGGVKPINSFATSSTDCFHNLWWVKSL